MFDYNTVLVSIVAILVSVVAYFLQRLVKTLDRIDANVSAHSVEIATIKQTMVPVPSFETKIQIQSSEIEDLKHSVNRIEPTLSTLLLDFNNLRTEHELISRNCQRRN